eukprot:gene13386-14759_t
MEASSTNRGKKSSDITSHKGKKMRSYTIGFKLEVVDYAKVNLNQAAATKFNVDRTSVREWRKKERDLKGMLSSRGAKGRKRLDGGGRKPLSESMEERLLEWVFQRRSKRLRVSRKHIMKKAKVIHEEIFKASKGWLDKFMKRHGLSLRRQTSIAQKDPDLLIAKIVSYILRVRRLRQKYCYRFNDIIAFDKTPVWADMVSSTTVDVTGSKTISLKTTGHEKCRVTVGLAAKGDGVKLKPFIVFKGAKQETEAMKKEFQHKCVVATSSNGWMDTDLTLTWINSVLGQFSFHRRLLAWDTYECHLMPAFQDSLKSKKIDTAMIPGGCTKYIQAPDVSWNKPFKAKCTEKYDAWLTSEGIQSETEAGNLKAPPRREIIRWILEAWDELSCESIKRSFVNCAITTAVDGSEDGEIHCFKEGQPCHTGKAMLAEQIKLMTEEEENPFTPDAHDIDAATPQDLMIDFDNGSDDDEEIVID